MNEEFYMAEVPSAFSRNTKMHITTSSARMGSALSLCGRTVYPSGNLMEPLWTDDAFTYEMFCARCTSSWLDKVSQTALLRMSQTADRKRGLQVGSRRGILPA